MTSAVRTGGAGAGTPPADVVCVEADFTRADHAQALVRLLDAYARDPMGGAHPLPAKTLERLPVAMAQRPFLFSVLAFVGAPNQVRAVGLINCVEGFSTFAARPLVNLHDVVVDAAYRGRGVAQRMIAMVETLARQRGACKLTLEVLSGNTRAKALYDREGFVPYQLDPVAGQAIFMQKWLDASPT